MYFKNQEENENLIRRLEHIAAEDKVSHAYIFEGSHCVDKKAFAESFIKGVLCHKKLGENCGECSLCDKIDHGNHEDIIYISPDRKGTSNRGSTKDEDIVGMQDRLKTKPFGDRNVVIIEESDTMTLRAQNRLLKTLEEPPGNSLIILLSENIENLVPTILSRCVKYRINYSETDSYDFMVSKAERVVEMISNREAFYMIKAETEDIAKDQESTDAFLDSLQAVYRDILIKKTGSISLYRDEDIINSIHDIENARRQMKQGVSPLYSIKNLLLKIGG